MSNNSLESLAAYTTPVQSQQQQTDHENDSTSGQKRKRITQDQQEEPATQPQQKQQTPQSTAPHHTPTPSPSRTMPSYEMPQYNGRDPDTPPASPTSPTREAQKRRKLLSNALDRQETNQGDDMEIDEDVGLDADQADTPTLANKRRWYEESPSREDAPAQNGKGDNRKEGASITVEVDELANAKTLARILTVADKPVTGNGPKDFTDPLDKYTKGKMPNIYDEDPASLLARIDPAQIGSWLALPTGKILARPFDFEVRYKPNHQKIAQELAAAAKEITGAESVAVAPPNKDPALPQRGQHPYTFLIHNISKEEEKTLLERSVWSSKVITFQAASIYIKRPEFLFTLKGFITPKTADVMTCITETWEDPVTTALIRTLASHAPSQEEKQEWNSQMTKFLRSVSVRHLDIRSQGGRENPHFNIYANGDIIEDDESWLQLRRYLRNRTYKTMVVGTGKALQEDFVCGLCHGHDHPRGLCPFPHIPGWNGGGRFSKRPEIPEPREPYPLPPQSNNAFRGRGYGRGRERGRSHTHPRGLF